MVYCAPFAAVVLASAVFPVLAAPFPDGGANSGVYKTDGVKLYYAKIGKSNDALAAPRLADEGVRVLPYDGLRLPKEKRDGTSLWNKVLGFLGRPTATTAPPPSTPAPAPVAPEDGWHLVTDSQGNHKVVESGDQHIRLSDGWHFVGDRKGNYDAVEFVGGKPVPEEEDSPAPGAKASADAHPAPTPQSDGWHFVGDGKGNYDVVEYIGGKPVPEEKSPAPQHIAPADVAPAPGPAHAPAPDNVPPPLTSGQPISAEVVQKHYGLTTDEFTDLSKDWPQFMKMRNFVNELDGTITRTGAQRLDDWFAIGRGLAERVVQ